MAKTTDIVGDLLVFNEVDEAGDSCFCAIGCDSESMKLEMRSVGQLLSETIGLPAGIFLWIFVSV